MLIVGILLISISLSFAQSKSVSLGNIYVPADGSVAIFTKHNFQEIGNGLLPGVLATDRSPNNGRIIFSKNSGWSNADKYSHIDGFVGASVKSPFLLPTGDNGIYGPIGFSNAKGIDAAYFAVDPSYAVTSIVLSNELTEVPEEGPFDINLNSNSLQAVSDREYWILKGATETKVSLNWSNHSDIEELVQSNLDELTIVGWDGTEWVEIPSTIDINRLNTSESEISFSDERSNFYFGSITTDEEIVPDAFSVISFGRLGADKSIKKNRITAFPNPVAAGSFINIRYELFDSSNGEIKLFNANNQIVYTGIINSQKGKIKIPLDKFGRGVFNVAISNEAGHTVYKKLIVVDM